MRTSTFSDRLSLKSKGNKTSDKLLFVKYIPIVRPLKLNTVSGKIIGEMGMQVKRQKLSLMIPF
jgi:hypothetical protein